MQEKNNIKANAGLDIHYPPEQIVDIIQAN